MGIANPGYYLRVRRERSRLALRMLKHLLAHRPKETRHAARTHCPA